VDREVPAEHLPEILGNQETVTRLAREGNITTIMCLARFGSVSQDTHISLWDHTKELL